MLQNRQKKSSLFGCMLLGGILLVGHFYTNEKQRTHINYIDDYGKIERLEQQLFNAKGQEAITALLIKHPLFSKEFLKIKDTEGEHSYQQAGASLWAMCQEPAIQAIYEESNRQFPDCSAIAQALQKAFCKLRCYYTDIKLLKVYTMITGMTYDLYVSNELIVIGLDYFLGKNPKFGPNHLPKYIANGYDPSSIVCKIMLLYTQQFNTIDPSDKTLLAEMLYYGKSFFLVKMLLPDTPDHLLIGYTPEQLKEVNRHKTIVWSHFIEHELLYHTNHLIKEKYIQTRPFTGEIGPNCPGSIGKWLGWEIIRKHMKQNRSETVKGLMRCTNSERILRKACYQPKDDR